MHVRGITVSQRDYEVTANTWRRLRYWRLGTRLERVRQTTLATVLTVLVEGHEDTSAAGRGWALPAETLDLAIRLYLVILQDGHLDLLAFVLDLFGSVVRLFLALLGATAQAEHKVEGGLLLDIIVIQSASILKLLSGKDEALLIRRNAFLILDLGLDIVDSIRGFHLKGDSFACESLNKDLHVVLGGESVEV